MKKNDVKTVLTVMLIGTLCASTLASTIAVFVLIFGNHAAADSGVQIFHLIFTLFTNVCTAVVTYFFTRKSIDSEHRETSK